MPVLIDTREGDKVDFRLLTDDAFDQARFARRAVEEFKGVRLLVSRPQMRAPRSEVEREIRPTSTAKLTEFAAGRSIDAERSR